MKLIVKVDPKHSKDPAKHVSKVLRGAGEKGRVEEVFPGLRDGTSAGLVSVTLPDAKSRRAALKALRDDDAISYVDTPKTRRALSTARGATPSAFERRWTCTTGC